MMKKINQGMDALVNEIKGKLTKTEVDRGSTVYMLAGIALDLIPATRPPSIQGWIIFVLYNAAWFYGVKRTLARRPYRTEG